MMKINFVFIICALLILICIIVGIKKGLMGIVYGLIAWIFAIWFVNFSIPIISEIILEKTEMSDQVYVFVEKRIDDKYEIAEQKDEGTGKETILDILPNFLQVEITETINSSVKKLEEAIATEITKAIIKGLSTFVAIVLAIVLVWLGKQLVKTFGIIPGVRGINRGFGCIAGLIEALLIIWLMFWIIDIFSSTEISSGLIIQIKENVILDFIYENNILEKMFSVKKCVKHF